MKILVNMFKVTLAVLLLKALVAVANDGDECCRDNRRSLRDIISEIETLKYLIKDLAAEPKKECK